MTRPAAAEKGHAGVATIAALLDLDARRIQQLARAGVIPKAKRGAYPIAESVRGYIRFLRSDRSPASITDFDEVRTRKMAAEAEMVELELGRERGRLVTVEDAAREVTAMLDGLRSNLLAFPAKHAHRLVGCKTIAEVTAKLEPAVHELMTVLASDEEAA